ncbi:MAG: hypothetical protein CVV07_13540 [Gammaproteobacteria bacterium HGW-Gammaproteobacteria-11]|nr:MAG: hypothetical protein CVV07_13540 [Gammaproteobacteria bacterium HGW-Gammaproteobacteria-11]
MRESLRVLEKGGLNIVGEVLRGQGTFYEMQHYPANDVYDRDSHAQYYYHAHRGSQLEHGHFHLFMRRAGMPPNTLPAKQSYSRTLWPSDNDAIAHLIAISMDKKGLPLGLFACNRWVTGETWYAADQVIGMLDAFEIDHAYPSWPTNLWLSSVVKVYRTEIEALLRHRDQIVTAWQQRFPDKDALEDRELEITGYLPITL